MNRTVLLIGPQRLYRSLLAEIVGFEPPKSPELTIGDTTYRLVETGHEVPRGLDSATTSWRVLEPRSNPWLYGAATSIASELYVHDRSFLAFVDRGTSRSGKTRVWTIHSWWSGADLGRVSWYAPWRRYTFAPNAGTVFDTSCLEEIAIFIAWKMSTRKAGA